MKFLTLSRADARGADALFDRLGQFLFDADRRADAGISARVRSREKWRISLAPVPAARTCGLHLTAVVADADYASTTAFRTGLERLGLRYAVAIRSNLTVQRAGGHRMDSVAALATQIPRRQWRRICWGQGPKAPCRHALWHCACGPSGVAASAGCSAKSR